MIWFLSFLILFLIICLSAAMFVAYRFYRKALIYDEIFQFLYDDIETNLMQFSRMHSSNVLSNEPEIETAHRNMIIMGKRLNEILLRFEEASGLRLRPPPPPPPPKVI